MNARTMDDEPPLADPSHSTRVDDCMRNRLLADDCSRLAVSWRIIAYALIDKLVREVRDLGGSDWTRTRGLLRDRHLRASRAHEGWRWKVSDSRQASVNSAFLFESHYMHIHLLWHEELVLPNSSLHVRECSPRCADPYPT